MHRILLAIVGVFSAFASSSPAVAEWYNARTDHFVLTIDATEETAHDFALRLERFDAALRKIYGVSDDPEQHLRPVRIYAFNPNQFSDTCLCHDALGFYRPQAAGSFIMSIYSPKTDRKATLGSLSSQSVLLHEYSHHFAWANFHIPYPTWFSEGFAEFNANSSFEPDGSVIIGYPANYRASALEGASHVSPRQLFDPQNFGMGDNPNLYYGRAWLLTHYLMLNPTRKGQLAAYLTAVNSGKPSVNAAQSTFGNLDQLFRELSDYRKGRLSSPLHVAQQVQATRVKVTPLDAGEAEMLPIHARAEVGIRRSDLKMWANRAAAVAQRHPGNVLVQEQWAELELLANRYDRADQAADAALKLNPGMVDALVVKGLVITKPASTAKDNGASTWARGRSWFVKANRADPNAVTPLLQYYLSYSLPKLPVPEVAVTGLNRAHILAPESKEIDYALGREMLLRGNAVEARAALVAVAFAPHADKDNVARQTVDLIDAGKIAEAKAVLEKDRDDEDD